jgi:hypothetical protein
MAGMTPVNNMPDSSAAIWLHYLNSISTSAYTSTNIMWAGLSTHPGHAQLLPAAAPAGSTASQ